MGWNLNTVFSEVTVSGRVRGTIEPSATRPPRLPDDPALYREWPSAGSAPTRTRVASNSELLAVRAVYGLST
ncbi:MAG: hypothetical protein ABI310_00245 [Microbacteriaceae bacterium]